MDDSGDEDKLLSPAEVARRLGVSPVTVRSWVSKGWLLAHMTPGGHSRFLWSDVELLLESKRQAATLPVAPRILVVDDNPQFRAYLLDALATLLPTAAVRAASDGFQAGMDMAEFQPDMVLLDYAMPGMNGAAVCRLIKSNPAYADTRVVAVTGYADTGVHAALTEAGADRVLLKPIPLATLEAMLHQFELRAAV
jgi:excisionase family DNA binding protein